MQSEPICAPACFQTLGARALSLHLQPILFELFFAAYVIHKNHVQLAFNAIRHLFAFTQD